MMRRSAAPVPVKPAAASRRLADVISSLKTARTRLDRMLKTVAIDDIGSTEDGQRLRKELWVFKHKLESLVPWLGRIRVDYLRGEVALRTDRKLQQLGVNPEEVLNREPH